MGELRQVPLTHDPAWRNGLPTSLTLPRKELMNPRTFAIYLCLPELAKGLPDLPECLAFDCLVLQVAWAVL